MRSCRRGREVLGGRFGNADDLRNCDFECLGTDDRMDVWKVLALIV